MIHGYGEKIGRVGFTNVIPMVWDMDALELFHRPPRPRCHHTLSVLDGRGPSDIFRTLIHILKCGINVLYGVDGEVHVDSIGEAEIKKLASYFLSFCVVLSIDRVSADTRPTSGSSLTEFSSVFRTPRDAFRVSFDVTR